MILFFWKGKWKVNFQFILKSYSQSRVALIITFLAGGYVYCLGFKLWEHVEWPRAESLEPGFRSIWLAISKILQDSSSSQGNGWTKQGLRLVEHKAGRELRVVLFFDDSGIP